MPNICKSKKGNELNFRLLKVYTEILYSGGKKVGRERKTIAILDPKSYISNLT